jgi:hypothetical protein
MWGFGFALEGVKPLMAIFVRKSEGYYSIILHLYLQKHLSF